MEEDDVLLSELQMAPDEYEDAPRGAAAGGSNDDSDSEEEDDDDDDGDGDGHGHADRVSAQTGNALPFAIKASVKRSLVSDPSGVDNDDDFVAAPPKKRRTDTGAAAAGAGAGAGAAAIARPATSAAASSTPPSGTEQPNNTVAITVNGKVSVVDREQRLVVVNKVTGKKLAGTAAPRAKNLATWLQAHPDFEVSEAGRSNKRRPRSAKPRVSKPKGEGGAARRTGGTTASRRKPVPSGHKIVWPLSESLEHGPGGVYISELRMLHREAVLYYQAGHFELADAKFGEAIEMAEKTLDEFVQLDNKIKRLPKSDFKELKASLSLKRAGGAGGKSRAKDGAAKAHAAGSTAGSDDGVADTVFT